jgi:hypothetical protein
VGVYFLSDTAQIANHQRSLQRHDLPTLDPASQNALRHPFSGVGAKQRQFFLAKGAQSPAAVCRKREYLRSRAETFSDLADQRRQMGRWKPGFKCVKARQWRAFLVLREVSPRKPDCLAGDAVGFEPISTQIPWYQGILQGILLFWGSEAGLRCKKPLSCSDFSGNSLRGLSGKII